MSGPAAPEQSPASDGEVLLIRVLHAVMLPALHLPNEIVNCHYEMALQQEKGALKFEFSPDSISVHLFEAAATPTS